MRFQRLPAHLALLLLSASMLLNAAERVVSVDGNDAGDGTRQRPWKTLQHSCAQLKPGDTLTVLPGEYVEKVVIEVSGSKEGGYITLQGEPGAVISGVGAEGKNLILIENQSYVKVIGLELRNNKGVRDGSGIRVIGHGSHIELRRNRIHEIRGKDAMGITIYGTDPAQPIDQLIIDGNEIYDCDPAKSEALTLNGNVSNFQVTNNLLHDLNNIGIDFIGGEVSICRDTTKVARNGLCKGNRVYRCRSRYEDGYGAGIYVDGGRDIVIEGNVVTQCDLGMEIGAENKGQVTSGIVVRDNVLFHNDKAGLVFGGFESSAGRVQNCKFTNNTCYQNNRHKKEQNGELWIQWANDNEVTGNTFISDKDSPLVQVDAGGTKGNKLNHNRYFATAGIADVLFQWRGNDVDGFDAWKKITTLDTDSVFDPVNVDLPVLGRE